MTCRLGVRSLCTSAACPNGGNSRRNSLSHEEETWRRKTRMGENYPLFSIFVVCACARARMCVRWRFYTVSLVCVSSFFLPRPTSNFLLSNRFFSVVLLPFRIPTGTIKTGIALCTEWRATISRSARPPYWLRGPMGAPQPTGTEGRQLLVSRQCQVRGGMGVDGVVWNAEWVCESVCVSVCV